MKRKNETETMEIDIDISVKDLEVTSEANIAYLQELQQTAAKANEIVQKARNQLSRNERRIVNYLISKIKPDDTTLLVYEFSIQEFCATAGINTSGYNYRETKKILNNLLRSVIWIPLPGGREINTRWIDRAIMDRGSGKVYVKLDELLGPVLIGLHKRGNYYTFELAESFAMSSNYSSILFELLQSHAFQGRCIYDIDDLKEQMAATNYKDFYDFRRRVLEPALREIEMYTDLDVTVRLHKAKGSRRIAKVEFLIKNKNVKGQLEAAKNRMEALKIEQADEQIALPNNDPMPAGGVINISAQQQEVIEVVTMTKAQRDDYFFQKFWIVYPKKEKREIAREIWKVLNVDEAMLEEILVGLERWKNSPQWIKNNGRYIQNAINFLSEHQWRRFPQLDPTIRGEISSKRRAEAMERRAQRSRMRNQTFRINSIDRETPEERKARFDRIIE
jgi:plasmid replication initiation protein